MILLKSKNQVSVKYRLLNGVHYSASLRFQTKAKLLAFFLSYFLKKIWPELESNQRHKDFQSSALPTELSGHIEPVRAFLYRQNMEGLTIRREMIYFKLRALEVEILEIRSGGSNDSFNALKRIE